MNTMSTGRVDFTILSIPQLEAIIDDLERDLGKKEGEVESLLEIELLLETRIDPDPDRVRVLAKPFGWHGGAKIPISAIFDLRQRTEAQVDGIQRKLGAAYANRNRKVWEAKERERRNEAERNRREEMTFGSSPVGTGKGDAKRAVRKARARANSATAAARTAPPNVGAGDIRNAHKGKGKGKGSKKK